GELPSRFKGLERLAKFALRHGLSHAKGIHEIASLEPTLARSHALLDLGRVHLRRIELAERQLAESLARDRADLNVRLSHALRQRPRRLIQLGARFIVAALALQVRH